MYSAWPASLISGIAAAIAMVVGMALQLSASSTPDPLSISFVLVAGAVSALVAGGAMTLAIRSGLLLAGCRQLAFRFVLIIPAVSLLILGVAATRPIKTHAVKLDMPSQQGSSIGFPLAFWVSIVAALVIPVLVSYVVGRFARNPKVPPNTSLERTRER